MFIDIVKNLINKITEVPGSEDKLDKAKPMAKAALLNLINTAKQVKTFAENSKNWMIFLNNQTIWTI